MRLNNRQAAELKLSVGTQTLITMTQLNQILDKNFQTKLEQTHSCQAALDIIVQRFSIDTNLVKPRATGFWMGKARTETFTSKNPPRAGWNVGMRTSSGTIPVFILHAHDDGWVIWVNQNVVNLKD